MPGAGAPDGSSTGSSENASGPGDGSTEEAGNDDSLPDLRDEPVSAGGPESPADGTGQATAETTGGSTGESGSAEGQSGQSGSGEGNSGQNGSNAAKTASEGSAGHQAPHGDSAASRTSAEQTLVLDDELERKTREFDAMILEEQAAQRRNARQQASSAGGAGTKSGSGRSAGETGASGAYPMEGGLEDQSGPGDNSTGGGMGGRSDTSGATEIPQNTAKYPPPANIPAGNDDDVVARQLREAAMREPDPELREKLWDEYRKYKGINN